MSFWNGERLEGNGFSQLYQVIRSVGYNVEVDVCFGTVTSAPPNLKVQIDNWPIELEKDDFIVLEHLTPHKRRVKITGLSSADLSARSPEQTAGGTYPEGAPTNSILFDEFTIENADLMVAEAEIEFLDMLAVGDRVALLEHADGQQFLILDRIKTY